MFRPTRRGFVIGGLATAAFAVARPGFAEPAGDADVLVVVFLRGAMDGLSLVPPVGGPDRVLYEAARPTLKVPLSGEGAALTLDGDFGLHPAAAPLLPLWDSGRLAVVHAAGMNDPTRSHFEAQDYLELGTPGSKSIASGWLHRHLASAEDLPGEILIPALAAGTLQPMSLLGSGETLTLAAPEYFTYSTGPRLWNAAQREVMRTLYGAGVDPVSAAGLQTIKSVDIVDASVTDDYTPAGGAAYPEGEVGERFELVAQMLTLDLGIRVATVDIGGWDTHENEGTGSDGYFSGLVASLAEGLAALHTDLDARGMADRLTVIVMTEFGRRITENADRGTDHGHAAPMLLIGDNVTGGLHGEWPGLEPDRLFEGVDLEVTTDFRRVLSEVLVERLGNQRIDEVFPGYESYAPLGVVAGTGDSPGPRRSAGRRCP